MDVGHWVPIGLILCRYTPVVMVYGDEPCVTSETRLIEAFSTGNKHIPGTCPVCRNEIWSRACLSFMQFYRGIPHMNRQ